MFVGWSELAELLEEARAGTPRDAATAAVSESENEHWRRQ
jgi:hypothetical protein